MSLSRSEPVSRAVDARRLTARALSTLGLALGTLLGIAACSDSVSAPAPQKPGAIAAFSGDLQRARVATTAGSPLVVVVHDTKGQPMAGALVNFTTTSNGSFDSPSVVTDSTGSASAFFTMGTVEGADTVVASVDSVATTAQFVLSALPSDPSQLAQVGPVQETGTAGATLATPFEIRVVDIFGNPIAGVTVTWSTTGGSLSATSEVTDANGAASVTLTLPASGGQQTVTAHVDNVSDVQFVAASS